MTGTEPNNVGAPHSTALRTGFPVRVIVNRDLVLELCRVREKKCQDYASRALTRHERRCQDREHAKGGNVPE